MSAPLRLLILPRDKDQGKASAIGALLMNVTAWRQCAQDIDEKSAVRMFLMYP